MYTIEKNTRQCSARALILCSLHFLFFFAFDTFVLSLKSIICKEAVNNVKEANINDGKCVQILLKPVYENKGLSLNHTE